MTPLLTPAEAAEHLRVGVHVVRHLIKTRQLPVVRIQTGRSKSGRTRAKIRLEDLEAYILEARR